MKLESVILSHSLLPFLAGKKLFHLENDISSYIALSLVTVISLYDAVYNHIS